MKLRKTGRKASDKLETRKSEARRACWKAVRRKCPFLENSTACQKSTPDMLTSPAGREIDRLEIPFEITQRGRSARDHPIPVVAVPLNASVHPITGHHSRRV